MIMGPIGYSGWSAYEANFANIDLELTEYSNRIVVLGHPTSVVFLLCFLQYTNFPNPCHIASTLQGNDLLLSHILWFYFNVAYIHLLAYISLVTSFFIIY